MNSVLELANHLIEAWDDLDARGIQPEKNQDALDALTLAREVRRLSALRSRPEILEEAVIAMAEDGWLYHGPEGMSDAQKKCYEAYESIRALRSRPEVLEEEIRGAVARGWTHPANAHKEMDAILAESITMEICRALGSAAQTNVAGERASASREWVSVPAKTAMRAITLHADLAQALALLQEWLDTELDSMDEEYQPWIDSFTKRVSAIIQKAKL